MNGLKHIFVVIALLVAAMPCFHAHELNQHVHDDAASVELCAAHTCSCHSCDVTPCSENLEMPQELPVVSITIATSPTPVQLFVLNETKPVVWQAPLMVTGTLVGIKTIQLLI